MHVIFCIISFASVIKGEVLDPALYLSPSPPLTTTQDNDAEKIWSTSVQSRINEKILVRKIDENNEIITTDIPEKMDSAETFWPSLRSSRVRGIYMPLSFHLSGTYGGESGSGVYSSGYVGTDGYGSRGKGALAGTSYQSYGGYPGLRIYGGDTKPAWSGWGNGKWGHYGKG